LAGRLAFGYYREKINNCSHCEPQNKTIDRKTHNEKIFMRCLAFCENQGRISVDEKEITITTHSLAFSPDPSSERVISRQATAVIGFHRRRCILHERSCAWNVGIGKFGQALP
jgi:hypothetical protein